VSSEPLSNIEISNAVDLQEVSVFVLDSKHYGYRFIKRTFDIIFSICVILVLLIPSILLCIIIALDTSGFPIFIQKRVGRHGKTVPVLKFRSMHVDAHSNPERYLSKEQMQQWKTNFKVSDDPRVTRFGRFLRETSIDEIPQFINVFIGQMSVVGPRPITKEETSFFYEDEEHYLSIKPGITGWWQTNKRNSATYEDGLRQTMELYYVDHAGVLLDTRIIFRTILVMFKRTGQ
jgi:lipopolysaccharide/colanic/teichoic acid biosynthesis glycosyltransferase